MITSNHIEYLKQELEPEEGYPHEELYAWAYKYIESYSASMRYASSSFVCPKYVIDLMKEFPWEHRYNTLVQQGTFFENIVKLESLRYDVESEELWKIALDLEGIPEKVANFEICYCWMNPGRMFSWDWRDLDDPAKAGYTPPFSSMRESNAWFFVNERYKKIVNKHLPICTVEEFMTKKI